VVKVTGVPGVTGLPPLSVRVAVMVVELFPSAGIDAGSASSFILADSPLIVI
jgi:hypothetical protein